MIKSMTGFGKTECETGDKKVSIELRSLNSKQLDINLKIPPRYRDKEPVLRNEIAFRLKRGKVDLIINIDHPGTDHMPVINRVVVKHYVEQLNKTGEELGLTSNEPLEMMKLALRMPDTLLTARTGPDEDEWEAVYGCFTDALEQTDNYRIREGRALHADFKKRITAIEKYLSLVDQHEKKRIDNIRVKLQQNLNEFFNSDTVDRNRFEQEIIFYLEKLDITEEKVRLKNHIGYFRETLAKEEPAGRKLGFINQEIGREINTIGSKANDFNIQKLVVQMKDELEKIKEQSLNIL